MTEHRISPPRRRGRAPFAAVRAALLPFALLPFALLLAAPAAADWLVLAGGSRVETRGPWEVKGKLVVFTSVSGSLASLRLSEVDLEASHQATAAAVEAERLEREGAGGEQGPPAPRPKPVLVLTDADVGHVDPAALEARRAAAAAVPAPKVVLYSTSWCGFCRQARTLLAELGVPFEEKDIEKSPAAGREFATRFGRGAGVPVLDVGGTVVRGFSEGEIRKAVQKLPPPAGARGRSPAADEEAPAEPPG